MLIFSFHSYALSPALETRIKKLEKVIGSYPPSIKSLQDHDRIRLEYLAIKREMDKLISKSPNDNEPLFRRAKLEIMGHNMDLPFSWDDAERDLKTIIQSDAHHKEAITTLAGLYVNTNPKYAPKAEELFLKLRALQEGTPSKEAESGLFFAYYYQKKICAALEQAKLLNKEWPDDNNAALLSMTQQVMVRNRIRCAK
jgi:hypothetical protein